MKRRDEILVGLFTTAAVVILVVGTIWLLRGGLEKGYALYGVFPFGSGLKEGQPVWISGVTVGFVDNVDLKDDGRLIVEFRIKDKYKVPLGTSATIVPNGFFGDVAIALTPKQPNPISHQPGDTVPTGVGTAGLQVLASRADSLSVTAQAILGGFHTQLIDSGGIREMRQALVALNRVANQLSAVVAVQSRQVEATMASVRARVGAVDSAKVDSAVTALQKAGANFEEITAELKLTSAKLNSMIAKVDSGQGSLGKLLTDEKLYVNMVSLASRVDSLMLDFKTNPRRYINLSIFGRGK
jgi:phospholipid/cholesterol/gamma-HCH transport system substrate-binding protein